MFDILLEQIRECNACPLRNGCSRVVVGTGKIPSNIMIFGEAPGEQEDLSGIPFIGASGKLLTECLEEGGLSRDDIYISNIVKCRPPKNRTPTKKEMIDCSHNTNMLLDIINPKLIVAAGQTAAEYFLPNIRYRDGLGKIYKTIINNTERYVYIIRHPAYAKHRPTPEVVNEVKGYIINIKHVYDKIVQQEL